MPNIAVMVVLFWFAFAVILMLVLTAFVTSLVQARRNRYTVKRWMK